MRHLGSAVEYYSSYKQLSAAQIPEEFKHATHMSIHIAAITELRKPKSCAMTKNYPVS
jgi:hypothetical protein